jgi:uncharacterized protein (DUF2126 family)
MAIHAALHHRTHYRYDRPVMHHPHIVRLRPAPHCRTPILCYSQKIIPEEHFINWQQDPFSNYMARLVFPKPSQELLVEIDLVVEMAVYNPFDFFLEESAEKFPFTYEPAIKKQLAPYFETTVPTPLLRDFLGAINRDESRAIDFLVRINQSIWKHVKYLIRLEPGVQTPEQTLQLSSGSCRDSAWLLVNVLRHLGLAARFVSGYLIQLKPDVKAIDGPSGTDVDFTDLHAWAEVFLPGAGWIGLDPTSGLLAGEGHIPLACAPEPTSAAPITGATDSCEVELHHEMKVTRIYESARVTMPYTVEQWTQIEALGRRVDEQLEKGDVRLTMGGEPTFIGIDHMDAVEWNFTALGSEKRLLAESLFRRLKEKFAPGALLHHGQGKSYPGESLPRWALGCYWRKDGQPIWQDPKLFAVQSQDYGHTQEHAEEFMRALARVLDVKAEHILPAYEDTWYYLWREHRLPTNVDPLQSHLENEEERARLKKIFGEGLSKISGYILPLQKLWEPRWTSGPWYLRREHLYLVPGDSPIGLRLPLDSLPWVSAEDYPYLPQADPTAPQPPLPDWQTLRQPPQVPMATKATMAAADPAKRKGPPGPQESAAWIFRTALCAEARNGCLHVFMPPAKSTEDYLELIRAIEETAALLELPIVIEGCLPPDDSRLTNIKVTPDPGVIEVNLQPARNWPELVQNTETLYEEARQARLGAEKFMIDGRHVGTGGGNHIVIGGSTPADSPILRRPDLLRSLVNYWQNHPSLSFLFSGLFIGPTSQHPRVDEARNDALYELEIAFKQVPEGGNIPPWLVDRIFRNLLVDLTGNTHRAEICIDKLYSPDSASGRLGLVELRAFEMPPHARMSLTQQLLLRSLIARFWAQPYRHELVRWGTALHDRFMLPHFVEQDFADVIEDLNLAGFPIQRDWFKPHLEFRFPQYGEVTYRGVNLEIRHALEPWHVLGEQGTAGGAVRNVDSSLERLQVRVRGMIDSRHAISCNNCLMPLYPTGMEGEYVAGVRFRAWQPPECLHPTIGVNTPLVFDIVDGWNARSIGGCTYHVAHPGGRNYTTLPVNAYEAESRRLARFDRNGHTPGPMNPRPVSGNPEHPMTLDLRLASLEK